MSRFGTISPEARARLDETEEIRKVFYLKLQTLAVQLGEDFTDEGDEGEPGRTLKYEGHLIGNYPWVYLDYKISGLFYIETLQDIDKRFKTFCESEDGAFYQNMTLNNGRLRLKLVFREDIAYQVRHDTLQSKGPPGTPGGPQEGI